MIALPPSPRPSRTSHGVGRAVLLAAVLILVGASAQPASASGDRSATPAPTTTTPTIVAAPGSGTSTTRPSGTGSGGNKVLAGPRSDSPIVPPPPIGWPRGATQPGRPGDLTAAGGIAGAPACVTTFDEDEPIDLLLNDAADTFVNSPFWNQHCSGDWVRIYPTGTNHYHLPYTDPDITACLNGNNDHGTATGQLARGAHECEPIDPVTEPRSHLHTMLPGDVIHIERLAGYTYTRKPFTLAQIKITFAPAKVCFRLGGPWEAAEPPPEGLPPGQFCWTSLAPGTYDLSSYTEGSLEAKFSLADPGDSNFGLDTIVLDW